MMRKIGSILVILLVAAAGIWFYLANKFEKMVAEELLPMIEKDHPVLKVSFDSIKVNKFKFEVEIKDLNILPNVKYVNIRSDKTSIYYNPFSDKITLCFNGDKLSTGTDKLETYTPSPNQKITFNRSLLKNDFDNINISSSEKDRTVYFASDDKFIGRSSSSLFKFTNNFKDDFYNINFSINIDKIEIDPELKYVLLLKEVLSDFFPNTDISDIIKSLESSIDLFKSFNQGGPVDYETEYSIKISKNQVDNIRDFLKGKKKADDIFDFKKDKYLLSVIEKLENSARNSLGSFYISNDGSKIKVTLKTDLAFDYTDEQKQFISELYNNYFFDLYKNIKDDSAIKFKTGLDVKDFASLSNSLVDTKSVGFDLDLEYDIESEDSTHSARIAINDFNIDLSSSIDNKIYTGEVHVHTPKMLVDGIANFYDHTIKNLLSKQLTEDRLAEYNKFIDGIRNNGFDALAALHKEDDLKEGDDLDFNIIFNPMGFEFKINDKSAISLLTDERVVKFLKNEEVKEGVDADTAVKVSGVSNDASLKSSNKELTDGSDEASLNSSIVDQDKSENTSDNLDSSDPVKKD